MRQRLTLLDIPDKFRKSERKQWNGLPVVKIVEAKFGIGAVVRHKMFDFRGVVFDVDPEFANTEDWYLAIPEDRRPRRDQPFYHLFAENPETYYVAYVSEQNLVNDSDNGPVNHPSISEQFTEFDDGRYIVRHHEA